MFKNLEVPAITPNLNVGDVLGGRFRIIRLLGIGAMGGVYLAHDTLFSDELIALKVFGKGAHNRDDGFERFIREAQIGRKIAHQNVCRIFDLQSEGDLVYVSMEYIPGQPLSQKIRLGPIPEANAVALLRQISEGLAAIHFKGIVHRDLKPSNILLTQGELVKIIDFGLARMLQSDLTLSSTLMGTAMYLAPELWDGAEPSFRSDVYALGIVAYQMITGSPPWENESMTELMRAHLDLEPTPPSEIVQISSGLEELILSLLDKDPQKRPLCDGSMFVKVLGVTVGVRRHTGTFTQHLGDAGANTISSLAGSPLAASRPIEPASGAFRRLGSERSVLASVLLGAVVAASSIVSGGGLQIVKTLFGNSVDEAMTIIGCYAAIMVNIFLVSATLSRGAFRLGITSNDRAVREALRRHIQLMAIAIWILLFAPIVAWSCGITLCSTVSPASLGIQLVTSVVGASILIPQVLALVPIQWGVSSINVGGTLVWTPSNPPDIYGLVTANCVLVVWVYLLVGLLKPPRRKIYPEEKRARQKVAARFLMLIAAESVIIGGVSLVLGVDSVLLRQSLMFFSPIQVLFSIINCAFIYWGHLRSRLLAV